MHYVMSDIHGDSAALKTILELIQLKDEDQLYVLGDVIDRGEDGIQILQQLRTMPNCTLLLGNHEYMMLNALRNPEDYHLMRIWRNNWCDHTYQWFQELDTSAQEELLVFLESLPVQVELEVNGQSYVLVHAAPMELYESWDRYQDPREYAVWKRLRIERRPFDGKTVIIGHSPTKMVQYSLWRTMRIAHGDGIIDIDCGCGFPDLCGQLACLRLEGMTEYYSKEGVVSAQEAAEWKDRYCR